MNLQNKTILVVGLGITGIAVCRFALKRGAKIIGVDDAPQTLLSPAVDEMRQKGIPIFSTHEILELNWKDIQLVVLSPGIALEHPLVQKAQQNKIPLVGEIELASSFSSSPLIAVTGTNGKSTTTELIGALLKQAGKSVSVGGNLGTPWVTLIDENPKSDWTVLEVSSFQLETIRTFHPKISVFLNITDDHFERHQNMQAYAAAKSKIFLNQTPDDFLIYNANDIQVLKSLEGLKAHKIPFSSTEHVKGIFWEGEKTIGSQVKNGSQVYSLEKVSLPGLHNIENMMAAIAVAELAGVSPENIQKGLENFKSLPHRLEFVRELGGVRYFDDSKGTNVGAVAMSLASFEAPVVLILGGKDKGGDYGVLRALIHHKAKALILMGEARQKIKNALEGSCPFYEVENMKEAVTQAHYLASAGDVVLLSPACSSFDMFRDYKHRGNEFQKWVKNLGDKHAIP